MDRWRVSERAVTLSLMSSRTTSASGRKARGALSAIEEAGAPDPRDASPPGGPESALGQRPRRRSSDGDADTGQVESARVARVERGEPESAAPPPTEIELDAISVSIEPSFQMEVIERLSVDAPSRCYRDAVRLPRGCALFVVVDLVDGRAIDASTRERWKRAIRTSAARSFEPDEALRALNDELLDAGLKATASCAVLDVRDGLLSLSSAGASPPWIVRAGERLVRVRGTPSVELGGIKSATFAVRRLHFGPRDTFILPSASWASALDTMFDDAPPSDGRPADWLRAEQLRPEGGCVLCLSLG